MASPFEPEENVSLARLTTIGTGGPARWFARPGTVEELQAALRWARDGQIGVEVIGLGSNLLAHDDGFAGLVLRLDGELAAIDVAGSILTAGGGATNAVCLHRARDADLGGFEFASAIPGTAGGGVRMNAGAYGREWRDVMVDATIVDADRRPHARPGRTRAVVPPLEPRRGRGRRPSHVRARTPSGRRREGASGRAAGAEKGHPADEPRTFGSVFKNPEHEFGAGRLIEECGLKGYQSGGARISPRPRELHRERRRGQLCRRRCA